MPPSGIDPTWNAALKDEWQKPYFKELAAFVESERAAGHTVFPPRGQVFTAFNTTPFDQVKVVIMGQDPYHGEGQAHGLSFSVLEGIKSPPSLQNIFKELQTDLGISIPSHGCLINWARQGVLLLNATLTVRQGEPMSHFGRGWETFTDAVISKLSEREKPLIFMLWGKSAQEKCRHLQGKRHHLLIAPHPSPFSAYNGFFGCQHFSKTNALLKQMGHTPINWQL